MPILSGLTTIKFEEFFRSISGNQFSFYNIRRNPIFFSMSHRDLSGLEFDDHPQYATHTYVNSAIATSSADTVDYIGSILTANTNDTFLQAFGSKFDTLFNDIEVLSGTVITHILDYDVLFELVNEIKTNQITVHADLSDLLDNDHPQYALTGTDVQFRDIVALGDIDAYNVYITGSGGLGQAGKLVTDGFSATLADASILLGTPGAPDDIYTIQVAARMDILSGSGFGVYSGTVSFQDVSSVLFNNTELTLLNANLSAVGSTRMFTAFDPVEDLEVANKEYVDSFTGAATVTRLDSFTTYSDFPSKASQLNAHGGLNLISKGATLNASTNIDFTKGIGKVLIVITAATDFIGFFYVTGTTVDRATGVVTTGQVNTFQVEGSSDLSDSSGTYLDTNGNTVYGITGAFLTSNWFSGDCAVTTSPIFPINSVAVDVYHVSYEQCNDVSEFTIKTFDMNLLTTNSLAWVDSYLYYLDATAGVIPQGNTCDIITGAALHVAAGDAPSADRYWRLRKSGIDLTLNGSTDGFWSETHYYPNVVYTEDITQKIWVEIPETLESSIASIDHGALNGLTDNDHPQYALTGSDVEFNSVEAPSLSATNRLTLNNFTGISTTSVADSNNEHVLIYSSGDSAVVMCGSTNPRTSAISFFIDGGGSQIETGIAGWVQIPFNCTLSNWYLLADQAGSAVIDVWKDTYANYPPTNVDSITNGNEPTVTSANKASGVTSSWSTQSISAGDILYFNIDSTGATIEKLNLTLELLKDFS